MTKRYLVMMVEITDDTELADPRDAAEFILEQEHPILSNPRTNLNQCNKGHGKECGTLHSDVTRLIYAYTLDNLVYQSNYESVDGEGYE